MRKMHPRRVQVPKRRDERTGDCGGAGADFLEDLGAGELGEAFE